ncbi:MAG: hypothetical protein NG747_07275 [Candidatus Brocadia sp.]|nr:hypothetical protein [Candidatus Brocadia sp.]
MKPHTGGDVEVQVCMVHAVHPPKDREGVEHHVLQVDGEVHNNYGYYYNDCVRYLGVIEKTPSVSLGKHRHACCSGGKDNA